MQKLGPRMLVIALLALVAAFAAAGTASATPRTTTGPAVAVAPAVVHPDTVQDCNGSTNNTWFHAYVLNSLASRCYGFMGRLRRGFASQSSSSSLGAR